MISICVIETNSFLSELIADYFSVKYNVCIVKKELISDFPFDIVIQSMPKIGHQCKNADIILLSEKSIIDNNFRSFGNTYFIVSSGNKRQLKSLAGKKLNFILCGMHNSDTVSFSSINDNIIDISLNREIKILSGRCATPFEMPVQALPKVGIYEMLALFAIRILIDDLSCEIPQLY